MNVVETVGRSLADGAGMFWETLWALVLGFALSGAVQAFVSREAMQRSLGDHRPRTIAKAGFFGAISSSCSYAASALAKTLFVRGADFTAAQAFMFASTNLVVELGIVLWLLIGWQFAAAEFVGGAIMIALIAVVLPRVVSPAEQAAARNTLAGGETGGHEVAGGNTGGHEVAGGNTGGHDMAGHRPADVAEEAAPSSIRSRAGWANAASYTISDLTMLRKELVIGFVVAGFADAAVPIGFWKSLFVTGHGFWSVLENVLLGPFLAIISFVCSVGNVPLAAALWSAGISFGGTIAFVFADLIALPLLLIYRKYYGTRLTAKLLAVFWATMSVSGLVTEYLFQAAGILPVGDPNLHGKVGSNVFGFNYTSVLDVVALLGFAVIYWLYRNRERFGAGAGYAKDPVCGMQVQIQHAPATAVHNGRRSYFCSDHCQHRFTADPDRFAGSSPAVAPVAAAGSVVDPVCGMSVDAATAAGHTERNGHTVYFCSTGCLDRFVADPAPFTTPATAVPTPPIGATLLTVAHGGAASGCACEHGGPAATGGQTDPVCGMSVDPRTAPASAAYEGHTFYFCNPGCGATFSADPHRYAHPSARP